MAVHIRLARHGSKKSPFYRIIVTDQRNPRDGRFIENLGVFDPNLDDGLRIQKDRFDHWCGHGAQPSATLARLLKRAKSAAAAASESPAS